MYTKLCYMLCLHAVYHMTLYMQEQQSAKGADPQPEYYIDKIMHLTQVIGGVYPMFLFMMTSRGICNRG